jgi:hypothetical protein
MTRSSRLQSAISWLKTYPGRDTVRGYRRWFGVDTVCAIVELRMLGIAVSHERLRQAKVTESEAARQRAAQRGHELDYLAERVYEEDSRFCRTPTALIAGFVESA